MDKITIKSNAAPAPIGPYNQAVLAGNTLYVSGQIALDAQTGQMLQSDIEVETQKVMENLSEVLKAAEMSFSNIVKTTIFLTDMNDFAKVNGVYGTFFKADFPARETVQVSALPKGARVEISVIAVK